MPDNLPGQMKIISGDPLNAETPVRALQEDLTPNSLFYVRNHFDIPEGDSDSWQLRIEGQVENARSFSLGDLKKLPLSTQRVILECAGNGRSTLEPPIKGTVWGFGALAQAEFTGTALRNVLDLVVPTREAIEVKFTGADSGKVRTGDEVAYERSMSLEAARDADVILAWAMNGEDLPAEHGFPLRLIVPDEYGMSSVKWLNEINLIRENFQGFFQVDDYVYVQAAGIKDGSLVGPMRVRALFASHADGDQVHLGELTISGIAWSGNGAISEVSYSLDGGENWVRAEVIQDKTPHAWARWQAIVNLDSPGEQMLMVRASDMAGNQQTMDQYWNKGGYGNNIIQRISVLVREKA